MEKSFIFSVNGKFDSIDKKLVPIVDANGNITSFMLPDGRYVQLVMALELVSADGNKFSYVTSESGMAELGFEGLDYSNLNFSEGV